MNFIVTVESIEKFIGGPYVFENGDPYRAE